MDKIFFTRGDETTLEQKVGYSVRGYFGDDFDELIWSDAPNEFHSKIKIFPGDNGKVHAILAGDKGAHLHTVNRVNKIHSI